MALLTVVGTRLRHRQPDGAIPEEVPGAAPIAQEVPALLVGCACVIAAISFLVGRLSGADALSLDLGGMHVDP